MPHLSLNWIDIIIFVVTAYLTIRGWQAGIIKTLFRVASVLAGLAAALSFREIIMVKLKTFGLFLPEFWLAIVSFVLIFIFTAICIQAIGSLIAKLIRPTPLGPIDRIAGALLGSLKAGLICIVIAFLLTFLPPAFALNSTLSNSHLLKKCQTLVPWFENLLNHHGRKLNLPSKFTFLDSIIEAEPDSTKLQAPQEPEN